MDSLSALDLAARIRRREISSEEAVRTCLDRIARLDPQLASFTDVRHYGALRDARRKDRAPSDAPFHGVPIGVKDLNLVRGTYTRFGSRAYKWLVSPVDDDVAKAVKRAGFVIVGKLATSEFGTMPITEPDIHLPTRNPWQTDHSSGGSSGGSGAAVAAGLVPLAHGSDGGGSIRIPSAFCHLYGFKTTRGLCPLAQGKVDRTGLGVEGPLGHTVDDAAAFVAALAGRPVPACRPTPKRLRVRFTTVAGIAPTAPEHAAATERLAAVLADLGHDVEPAGPLVGTLAEFLPIWARMSADLPIPREATLQPVTRWLRQVGRRSSHADAQQRHGELAARIHAWWDEADVVLTPTVGGPPPRVGAFRGLDPEAQFEAIAPIGQFTAPFNVAGNPAASIPVGVGADGLPIGVQLVGRVGEDALVLDLSRRLEEVVPWRQRRAPLAGGGVAR